MPDVVRLPFLSSVWGCAQWGTSARSQPAYPVAAGPHANESAADVATMRAAAMRRMFPKLHSWRASWHERREALAVHSYLSDAATVTDLRHRIRAVEHARHLRG